MPPKKKKPPLTGLVPAPRTVPKAPKEPAGTRNSGTATYPPDLPPIPSERLPAPAETRPPGTFHPVTLEDVVDDLDEIIQRAEDYSKLYKTTATNTIVQLKFARGLVGLNDQLQRLIQGIIECNALDDEDVRELLDEAGLSGVEFVPRDHPEEEEDDDDDRPPFG
jgi:hypothetical protein